MALPKTIESEDQLENVLTTPSEALVEYVRTFTGTVAILGIGRKMGTAIGVRLRRALDRAGSSARVLGVSRFTDSNVREQLEASGIETVQADLLDPSAVARERLFQWAATKHRTPVCRIRLFYANDRQR